MTPLREAAEQALAAMEAAEVDPHSSDAVYRAIEALRAALAEPGYPLGKATTDVGVPVYVVKKAEPVQEPVAVRWRHPQYRWTYEDYKSGQFYGPRVEVQRLYTAPPQRKPLTEETMRECAQAMDAEPLAEGWHELIKFARAIERAHGIGGQE